MVNVKNNHFPFSICRLRARRSFTIVQILSDSEGGEERISFTMIVIFFPLVNTFSLKNIAPTLTRIGYCSVPTFWRRTSYEIHFQAEKITILSKRSKRSNNRKKKKQENKQNIFINGKQFSKFVWLRRILIFSSIIENCNLNTLL